VTLVSALADGAVTIGGAQVVSFDGDAIGGALPWLAIAAVALAGGVIAAVVSWIGALISTARLDDKTWFVGLLVLGLISLGWVAMVGYAVAGPDGAVPLSVDQGVAPAPRISRPGAPRPPPGSQHRAAARCPEPRPAGPGWWPTTSTIASSTTSGAAIISAWAAE
jgi:hypothetical protein